MKIVLLGPANVVHTRRWFYGLCEAGHQVALISQHRDSTLVCPPLGSIHYLPYKGTSGYFLNAHALRKLLQKIQPDLVNTHYASGYGMLSSLAQFRPTVLSVWGSDVYDFPYELPPLKMWLICRILRRSDRITSTSKVMAAQVSKLAPDIAHIDITPFGVDTSKFRPIAGVRDDAYITVGTVKTLERKYGIDTLIRAFARLWNDKEIAATGLRRKLRLVLIGQGKEHPTLTVLTKELGIEEYTTFVGAIPHSDVPNWLNKFDIYVAASRLDSESFGVAVIEASSCGVPVIVSDKGGLPEVVEQDVTGFVVPAEDDEAIARYMKTLVLDPELRHTMGEAGRKRVIDNYEWDACVDKMVRCYGAAIEISDLRATMK